MIKKATVQDIDKLVNTGIGVLGDMPNYATSEYDPEHVKTMATAYIALPNLGIFFEELDGEIVGLYMGIVSFHWFSPTLELSEIMLWVRSDHRGKSIARKLISASEEWAITQGAKRSVLATSSGYKIDKIEKYYNRLGYKTTGLQCTKELF